MPPFKPCGFDRDAIVKLGVPVVKIEALAASTILGVRFNKREKMTKIKARI